MVNSYTQWDKNKIFVINKETMKSMGFPNTGITYIYVVNDQGV